MSVNSLIFLPAIFLTNKKDDEDMLSPSLYLSFNLPAPFWVNIKFKIFILATPKIRYKNLLTKVKLNLNLFSGYFLLFE